MTPNSSAARFNPKLTRRNLLRGSALGAGALALYSGEIERHWIDHRRITIQIAGLPTPMVGLRIAQVSDIHLESWTEPFFLREAVERVNRIHPDLVLLTGDFITAESHQSYFPAAAMKKCAEILADIQCTQRYGILGNHDATVDPDAVVTALHAQNIPILRNRSTAIERGGARLWLAGIDDMLDGNPDLDKAIPPQIRNIPDEPVIFMGHEPDPAIRILRHPAGASIRLMLSGHTHGGQVRLPLLGAIDLPPLGRRFVEGLYRLGSMQLYVNRGLGTVGVPFRFDCPPEITEITLSGADESDSVRR